MKKFFQILLDILIVLLSVFIIIKLVGYFNKKNGISNYFGYTYFEILSGSMEDTIHIGDYVFVKLENNDIKENDVISFYDSDNNIITHRVVEINGDSLITKGDNNNSEDDPIVIDDVIGKVVYVGKGYGTFVKTVVRPYVFIPIILMLMVINYFLSREVNLDEEKKKQ